MQVGHGSDAGCRIRRQAGADLDGHSAVAVDDAEAVLVGHVVADEDGDAAGEWRFGQELFDDRALGRAFRLHLQHHLAFLDVEAVTMALHQACHDGAGIAFRLGRVAVMERHGHALGFQPGAGMGRHEGLERADDVIQGGVVDCRGDPPAIRIAPLQSVLTGRSYSGCSQHPVDIVQPAAAYQRHGTPQRRMQPGQQIGQFGGHLDAVGLIGDFHQRAVEVQEQSPIRRRLRQFSRWGQGRWCSCWSLFWSNQCGTRHERSVRPIRPHRLNA